MYNIPNDNYTDFRINSFVEYYRQKHSHNDSDVYNLKSMCKLSDKESYIWVSFLYSTCYSVATTALIFSLFPNIQSVTKENLNNFWNEYKDKLIFQSDRRWVKRMDKFCDIVLSYKDKIKDRSQYSVVSTLIEQSDKKVFDWFTSIYYCGRFSAMLFMESVYGMLGIDLTQEGYLDFNECKTCSQGILVIYYQDDLANRIDKFKGSANLSKTQKIWMEKSLKEIINYTENNLGYKTNFARIVGYLCSYFKLYKKKRYLEFYTDRRLEELIHYEKVLPEYSNIWKYLYEIRYKNVPHNILGELCGWKGIRKERLDRFVSTGSF